MSGFFHSGAVLEGRFKLGSALGEGAMGTVWLAKDLHLGIDVAVKVMQSALRAEEGRREMFEREAELCARMLSPHIVRVLSYGVTSSQQGDVPYIIYEALEGEPLDTRIASRGKISLDETEEIVVHVARALARAHSMGIVHKDIKPGNVFMTKDDRGRVLAKVIDFGISEVIQPNVTIAGELCGTLEYMPLEVLRDAKPADARADLFALAVLAYECLCGEVPYVGESIAQVMKLMSGAPPSLTKVFNEEGAVVLDQWFRRGLAPDAGLRFQSARDLAETFHDAVKQAKFALGMVAPASSRKLSQQVERPVSPNSVDKVTAGASRLSQNNLAHAAEAAMKSLGLKGPGTGRGVPARGPTPPPPMMATPSRAAPTPPVPQNVQRIPPKAAPPVPPSKPGLLPNGARPGAPTPAQASSLKPQTLPSAMSPNRPNSPNGPSPIPGVSRAPTPPIVHTPGQMRPVGSAPIPREDGAIPPVERSERGERGERAVPATIPREDAPPQSQRAPMLRPGTMRPRAASFVFDEDSVPQRPKQQSGVAIEEAVDQNRSIADKRRE
jgi:serine/threonine-protein kinase